MDESDLKQLNLYLDGRLATEDEQALELRLAVEAPLRVTLDSLRSTDRWLREPSSWEASPHDLARQLSLPPVGEENAELGALRAAIEAHEDGAAKPASQSLLQRIQARGTPSRSRSGRRRKASVRMVRRSARLRHVSNGSARIRRRSARITPLRAQSARRAPTRVASPSRVTPSATPWSAWVGLVAAACMAVIVGGLLIGRTPASSMASLPPSPEVRTPGVTPDLTVPDEPQAVAEPAVADPRPIDDVEPFDLEPVDKPSVGVAKSLVDEPTETQVDPEPIDEPTETFVAKAKPIVDDGGRLTISRPVRGKLERRLGDRWERVGEQDELAPGQRLRATVPSFASLDGGAYELSLDAGTEFVIRSAQNGPVLDLENGRLLAEVASLQQHERFEVRAGVGAFSVLGTVFEVELDGAQAALGVLEGAVRASRGADSQVADAGHGVRVSDRLTAIDTPQAGAWASKLRPRRDVQWSVDFESGSDAFQGEPVATPARGGSALALNPSSERAWARGTAADHAFKVTPDLYVQLSVFSEEDASVLLRFVNASQDGRPFMATYAVRAGQWRTLTIPVDSLSTLYDPALNPLRHGDRLTQLEVLAGESNARGSVLIDDVRIYRKRYR